MHIYIFWVYFLIKCILISYSHICFHLNTFRAIIWSILKCSTGTLIFREDLYRQRLQSNPLLFPQWNIVKINPLFDNQVYKTFSASHIFPNSKFTKREKKSKPIEWNTNLLIVWRCLWADLLYFRLSLEQMYTFYILPYVS